MKAIAAAGLFFVITGCSEPSQSELVTQPAVEESELLRSVGNPDSEAFVWFLQAGATGHGRDRSSPFGSTVQVEDESRPCDVIFLLPADMPLDYGLTLKPRQTLIGVAPESGKYPVLSNTTGERNSGHGLILADSVRVAGIEIRNTHASGIYGVDASNVELSDVVVSNANTAQLNMPEADVQIGASAVEIDARRNCWLSPNGHQEARIVTADPAGNGTVDTSNPVPCER